MPAMALRSHRTLQYTHFNIHVTVYAHYTEEEERFRTQTKEEKVVFRVGGTYSIPCHASCFALDDLIYHLQNELHQEDLKQKDEFILFFKSSQHGKELNKFFVQTFCLFFCLFFVLLFVPRDYTLFTIFLQDAGNRTRVAAARCATNQLHTSLLSNWQHIRRRIVCPGRQVKLA